MICFSPFSRNLNKNISHIDIQSGEKVKEVSLSLERDQKPCGRMEKLSKADTVNGKALDAFPYKQRKE